jgi:SNF2 family DNA or RNA helicase
MPGFLTNLENFSKKYKIKDFDEDSEEKIKNLQKLISPFILRRRKKDVIKDLPEKIENNIYVELTKEQKKLYLAELEKVQTEMDEILKTEGIAKARFLILKLLTKLRQICIEPKIVFEDYQGGSGKIDEFLEVVKTMTSEGHKILVFTSFRTALELVRKELTKNNISSYTIDGSVTSKKRMELVDKFNTDDTNVFLIMLKAGGTGLNLTSADIVIHLDLWWNPQAENQATDRAHRIGQKNKVQVIKLITKGTIEEKILDLQQKKKVLSEKLIDENNVNQGLDKLTEKDIKDLLAFDED